MIDGLKTRGTAMILDAENVLRRLQAIRYQSFTRHDLSDLIEPFTSRLEYFLKSVVFPTADRRLGLARLIEDLAPIGAAHTSVVALHRLRELYNQSKHDPAVELTWQRCNDALAGSVEALRDLATIGIRAVDAPFTKDFRSIVIVGFWDHYNGGETEVALFLPSDHWLGVSPCLSNFHLPISAWGQFEPLLTAHPSYATGEAAVGAEIWKKLADEGDFVSAGVWDGEMRELLAILAGFNDEKLEKAVLPMLARRNNISSLGIAIVSAAVDLARAHPDLGGPELRSALSTRAQTQYAAEIDSDHGQTLLDRVLELIEQVPELQRTSLAGPAFRRVERDQPDPGSPISIDGTTFVWLIP